ncbi:Membrane protein [Hydrogenophaga intermedia]|uniref:Membrane protein n=2 Tax=Comamonadaceae TaxID=80864 RepID=A0A1L1PG18_HYDIT|nr:Membrane protein [Hydrogenophaga intermedia]
MQVPPTRPEHPPPPGAWARLPLALAAMATGMLLVWILHYSRYGFDFTDEGFYLNWVSNPFLFDWSLTQFGFVYHPLYLAVGGDVASLRQANIGIIFLLSWCLTWLVMRAASAHEVHRPLETAVVSAGWSVACLVTFSWWLVTPNYNSLAFQALLVASIGIVLADKIPSARSIAGWLLIGLGGCIAFLAKPSTAMALALVTLAFLLAARKLTWRLLVLAIATALVALLVSVLLIDGSLHAFIGRLETGLAFYDLVGAGHTVAKTFRLGDFQLQARERVTLQLSGAVAFAGAWCALQQVPRWRLLALLVSAGLFATTTAIVGGAAPNPTGFGEFRALILIGIVFACAALLLVRWREVLPHGLRVQRLLPVLLFLAMPYAYAIGSNGNYWWVAGFVGFFWLLAGVVLLGPLAQARGGWGFALPLVFATQALSALLLQLGFNQPYRQPQTLSKNNSVVSLGQDSSRLVLSEDFAQYVNAIQQAAQAAGLRPGTPVVDLSGQSPGVLYAMQAMSIGQAWTVGGYPGSQKLAEAALARVPCELLSAAWLLVEESGPRRLPTDVVASYGASFETHFALAAKWHTAPGAGGYAEPREQKLYKPTEVPVVLTECHERFRRTPQR